ncbi:recombinase family protein [Serratia marcescens]|uniref:recombinase family protein n=1 Tax=Serratia marcescens TaxID=615 RepID=UPI002778107A|nr:recombinase family protein [Serratia marcescens]MDP8836680.1 recombinase family protein [Serratia marcescens]
MMNNTSFLIGSAYLRASTDEQDADRARRELKEFAEQNRITLIRWYVENESGTKLERPELNKLLTDAAHGETILIERMDRLSRLTLTDWERLKQRIKEKNLRLIVKDIPTTLISLTKGDNFDIASMVMGVVNDLLIEIAAASARADYETLRKRQAQGIEKAKQAGKYTGKPADTKLHKKILKYAAAGHGTTEIAKLAGCSRSTVLRVTRQQ